MAWFLHRLCLGLLLGVASLASGQRELGLLSAAFKHFRYHFQRYTTGHVWQGEGELWAWFPSPTDVAMRFQGISEPERFGKVNITTIIDTRRAALFVNFDFKEMAEQQCLMYPFQRPDADRGNAKIALQAKLQRREQRLEAALATLSNTDRGDLSMSWTPKKKRLKLRFSPDGVLEGADMYHSDRLQKKVQVNGTVDEGLELPADATTIFDPPENCQIYSNVANPLAKLGLTMPHRKSTALRDLMAQVSKDHLQRLIDKPDLQHQLLTLSIFALPGDIAVMIEEPQPPMFTNQRAGIKYDYVTKTRKLGTEMYSNGTVWLNATERAFRIFGEAPSTPFGPAFVNVIARAETAGNPEELARIKQEHITKQPVIFDNVELTTPHAQQCITHQYPQRQRYRSIGIGWQRSLMWHLRFIEVTELYDEDAAIFATALPNGHKLIVWVDQEADDHHAILRVDIRNKTKVLRSTVIQRWYDDILDYGDDLLPSPSWHCQQGQTREQFAFLGLSAHKRAATELVDTLYAIAGLPTNFALLELLALPGDLEIQIKQTDGSGAYTPSPAKRAQNFLKSSYKHFSYAFERHWWHKTWMGEGELWMWFRNGEPLLRFRGHSMTKKFGVVEVTIVIDSAKRVMYTNFNRKDLDDSECLQYAFPDLDKSESGYAFPDAMTNLMNSDALELETLETALEEKKFQGIKLPWSQHKDMTVMFTRDGEFLGLDMTHRDRLVKHMHVIGQADHGDEPPPEFSNIFDAPASSCKPVAAVSDPIAKVMADAPHHRSHALRAFMTVVSVDANPHMTQLLSLLAFSLPGDVPVIIEAPQPPMLDYLQGIAFDYEASVFEDYCSDTVVDRTCSGVERHSSGAVWSSLEQRAFHLSGVSEPTSYGRVKVDLIARARDDEMVYTNIRLPDLHPYGTVQQCIAYPYPAEPGRANWPNVAQSAAQPLSFIGVQEYDGDDCSIFAAPISQGRTILLWVDDEIEDHHAIKKVSVHDAGSAVMRKLKITQWHDHEDFLLQLEPAFNWSCAGEPANQKLVLGHFGIDHIRKRSRDVHDALHAMQDLSPSVAMLELLSLPGDVSIKLDQALLEQSASIDKSYVKPVSDSPLPPPPPPPAGVPLPPGVAPVVITPTLEPGAHSSFFVAMSLGLSLVTLLSTLMLLIVAAAAGIGLPVPLLAALPATSSTVFSLQLASAAGRTLGTAPPLADLCRFLGWVLPSESTHMLGACLAVLSLVFMLRVIARQHQRAENGKGAQSHPSLQCSPHGLSSGTWELRALGILAFPLAVSCTELFVDSSPMPVFGPALGIIVLFGLWHTLVGALKFVTDKIEDKEVVRTRLPRTAGGAEVYVDRVCNQLRALPARPPQPGCSVLFGGWLATPAWSVAPVIAAIRQIEHQGAATARVDDDMEQGALEGVWCTSAEAAENIQAESAGELRTEVEGRPLLESSVPRQDSEVDGAPLLSREDTAMEEYAPSTSSASASSPEPLDRPSTVALAHPVKITTAACYDSRTDSLVAGVICIPWLDCAIPASALRRLEELCGDLVISTHPGQLCGPLTSGRYAACFDWGTNSAFRWPTETALKAFLGSWIALPMHDALAGPFTFFISIAVVCVMGIASFTAYQTQPYGYSYDNAALLCSWVAATLTVFVRSFGIAMPGAASLATMGIALSMLVACLVTLLAALALISVMLGRFETQGLQDRLLPYTIDGWGSESFTNKGRAAFRSEEFERALTDDSPGGCGMAPESQRSSKNSVEVILPGPRPAFAIVMPAVTRPPVAHVQLLPSMAGRSGDGGASASSATPGDCARLPLPPSLLFASAPGGPRRSNVIAPLAALLAPGRPGRLIYEDTAYNENGEEWPEAVQSFFGSQGGQLADETERLVKASSQSEEGQENTLVVVEVLPAFAAEFMDDRTDPPSSRDADR